MQTGEIVVLLLAIGFALLVLRAIVDAVRKVYAQPREAEVVDGHLQLFRADNLLTEAERRFATHLEPAMPEGCRLLAKCRIMELVQPVVPEDHRFHETAKRMVLAKDVDFVIADRDWKVLCAVELDDRSHRREDRRARDRLVDAVFRDAGLPLLRVRTDEDWSTSSLKQRIAQRIAENGRETVPAISDGRAARHRRKQGGTGRG